MIAFPTYSWCSKDLKRNQNLNKAFCLKWKMQLLKAQDSFTTHPPPPLLFPFAPPICICLAPNSNITTRTVTMQPLYGIRDIYIYIYKQHKHLCHHQLHHQTYCAHSQQPISHLCVDSILLHCSTTNCTIVSTPLVQNTQLLLLHYHQSMLPWSMNTLIPPHSPHEHPHPLVIFPTTTNPSPTKHK